jgi:hypothetical protein
MNKRILISAPINSRGWVLPYYLEHIYNISYDRKLIDIYWLTNSIGDDSLELLNNFRVLHINEYNSITIENFKPKIQFQDKRTTEVRMTHTYDFLSFLRNKMFEKCVSLGCDFLLNCDCDILVPTNILNCLLTSSYDVTASLIYNGYLYANSIDEAYKYPNILKYDGKSYVHIVNYYVKNPDKSPIDKILECDATGACCLISKEVCKNTSYKKHSQGEDLGWADDCRSKGYKMYCLPHCFSQHIMSPEFLTLIK